MAGRAKDVFRIFERHQTADGWSTAREVSAQSRNCWAPAITSTNGKVAIAWDTYEKGDYDVWVREFPGEARPVADTPDYEARPCLLHLRQNRRALDRLRKERPDAGKDWGALVKDEGIGLYRDRQIGLAVLKDGQWMQPPSLASVLPGAGGPRKKQRNVRVPAIEPGGESRKAGEEAEAAKTSRRQPRPHRLR